jgi:hypothetical protein
MADGEEKPATQAEPWLNISRKTLIDNSLGCTNNGAGFRLPVKTCAQKMQHFQRQC